MDKDQKLHQKHDPTLLYRPTIAIPTVLLFICSLLVWLVVLYKGPVGSNQLSVFSCVSLNTIVSFVMFTVIHDAAHRSLSQIRILNETLGRLSMLFLGPMVSFPAFRYVHLQHHKWTNDPEKDPDYWSGSGPTWSLPLRWLVQEIHYYIDYFRNIKYHAKLEVFETVSSVLSLWIFTIYMWKAGYQTILLVHWIIPARIAVLILAYSFDYLPHFPHKIKVTEDRYKTTSLLLFPVQMLFTLIMLYQDFHVIHHLYPTIPFYRYKDVYYKKQQELHERGIPVRNVLWSNERTKVE